MSDQALDASRITIDPIFTCRGDQGETSLVGGHRVAKDNARIEAYGVIDELNAFFGSARALAEETTDRNGRVWPLVPFLLRVQHELFNIGCILATRPEEVHPSQARVTLADVTRIEHEIDRINRDLPARRCFVLSGNRQTRTDANNHVTTWTYDVMNRVQTRTLPGGGATETYTYNPAGTVFTVKDFNGKTTTFAYDKLNRLTTRRRGRRKLLPLQLSDDTLKAPEPI
jgi:ATP:cob(I)alamin adenosyltransferase